MPYWHSKPFNVTSEKDGVSMEKSRSRERWAMMAVVCWCIIETSFSAFVCLWWWYFVLLYRFVWRSYGWNKSCGEWHRKSQKCTIVVFVWIFLHIDTTHNSGNNYYLLHKDAFLSSHANDGCWIYKCGALLFFFVYAGVHWVMKRKCSLLVVVESNEA